MGMLSQGFKTIDAAGRQQAKLLIYHSFVVGDNKKNEQIEPIVVLFSVNPSSINLNLNVAVNRKPEDKSAVEDAQKGAKTSEGEEVPAIVNEATANYVMGNATGTLSFSGYFDVADAYDQLNSLYSHFSATSINVNKGINKVKGLLNEKTSVVSAYLSKKWNTFEEKLANKVVNGYYGTDDETKKHLKELESKKEGGSTENKSENASELKVTSDAIKKEEKKEKEKQKEIQDNADKYDFKKVIEVSQLMQPDSPVWKIQHGAQNDSTFVFEYGPKQFGPAKLTSLNIEYSYFSKSGAPLRAKVDISLQAGGGQKVSEWMKPVDTFQDSYSGLSSLLNGFIESKTIDAGK